VAPEVSALDTTAGVTISGFTIPAITSRKVQTEIELRSGESFAISGLLDRRLTETLSKVPLLSSVPVLGKLFQSKSLSKQNTELLVIVTPEIVQPIREGQPRPSLNMPIPLWGPETAPRTPGAAATPSAASEQPASIPVEKLIESLKLQKEMKLNSTNNEGAAPSAPWPSTPSAPPKQ
jgi:pilus assembly protein CpaC